MHKKSESSNAQLLRGHISKNSLPKIKTPRKVFDLGELKGYESIDCERGRLIRDQARKIGKGHKSKDDRFDLDSLESMGQEESLVRVKGVVMAETGRNQNEIGEPDTFMIDNRLDCKYIFFKDSKK